MLYRCGLRISEALALRPSDLDGNALTVVRGKGGKRRVVGVDAWTAAALSAWNSVRPASKWLFCNLDGKQLESSYPRHLLRRLAKRAGIPKRVHPHGLRHSFASDSVGELPLPIVQQALGHEHISTTAKYVHALNPTLVINAMAART